MSETAPNFSMVLAREMTKKFEEFTRGSTIDVFNKVKNRKVKGEIVIILNKSSKIE